MAKSIFRALLFLLFIALCASVGWVLGRPRPIVIVPHEQMHKADREAELPVVLLPTTTITPPITTSAPLPPTKRRPQFVLISFDGSWSLSMWDQTLTFADRLRQNEKPIHFTYFISGVYFLSYADRFSYHAPGQEVGKSAIGFASNDADISKRIEKVNTAIRDGHEIGTHFNGHYDGSMWSKEQWQSEFTQFYDLIFKPTHAFTINANDIHGGRTPVLGVNQNYYDVAGEHGFTYDSSAVGKPGEWPRKTKQGFWEIPLANITYVPTGTNIISMDYNFYYKQTGAKDTLLRDTPEWNEAYRAMLDSFMKYFNDNYNGTRAPVVIGNHFSLWNDGVYWDALKQFATNVCGMPDVHCTTFSEAVRYLENPASYTN